MILLFSCLLFSIEFRYLTKLNTKLSLTNIERYGLIQA
jgi:hypothetical protein